MPGIGSQACPKPIRGLYRHQKRKSNEEKLDAAYAEVDKRDEGYSVVSGIYTIPGHPDPKLRREHHHFKGRNVRPDWKYAPERIATLTAFEHQLAHAGALEHEGDDMRQRVVWHWNRALVKRGEEPFRIRSKRWSQNREL